MGNNSVKWLVSMWLSVLPIAILSCWVAGVNEAYPRLIVFSFFALASATIQKIAFNNVEGEISAQVLAIKIVSVFLMVIYSVML